THLLHSPERNPAIYGPGATASNLNSRRPFAGIGPLQVGESTGWSKYHALQLTLQKRWGKGLTVLANYTFSKSIDISSYATIEGNSAGPDPFNFNNNRGVSDFDMPQRLVVSGIWEHPRLTNYNPILRTVLGGWQSNVIWTAQAGTPITILSGVDNALMGIGANFADLTGVDWRPPSDRSRGQEVQEWFNKAAFRVNAVGTIGTGRRNQLRSPGAWNADYSLFKNFSIVEALRLQFRAEFFNVFNHTRLGAPNTTFTSPSFARITSAYDPRIVQLGLKLIF
ncbi:MAG: TonB-dependent receptor, partial [Pyrinomonadaceae bacterium]|nr:TonB-dependent receptor [Pyrinomonadaceae bacterium]